MKAYDELKKAVDDLAGDVSKADKGNASAQRRIRTSVTELVKLAKALKAEYPAGKKEVE